MYDTWLDEHIDYRDPDEPADGLAACDDCGEVYPESALWDGVCARCAEEWRYINSHLLRHEGDCHD